MSIRMLAAAIALAAAIPAQAEVTSGEWDTKYGMVFELNNPLVENNYLDAYKGGVGLQYNLSGTTALRGMVSLGRSSDPSYDTSSENLATEVKTDTFDPSGPSVLSLDVGAAYLIRLGGAPLAPYVGVGVRLGFDQTTVNWEDDITSTTVTTTRDDTSRTFSVAASGLLGLEWRIHKVISIFAEYGVNLTLAEFTSSETELKNEVDATGAVSGTRTESSRSRFLQFDTGLNQGANLGLVAHF